MEPITDLYKDIIESHTSWLKGFKQERSDRWKTLLRTQTEAAICEACVRDILSQHVDTIKPNEDPSYGGPDFICKQGNAFFYVEVTCITIESATKSTTLTHPVQAIPKKSYYRYMTEIIRGELVNKARQCSGLDEACILAIGTLHSRAGPLCMNEHAAEEILTGTSFFTAQIDTRTGQMLREPYEATDLRDSSFVRSAKTEAESVEEARKTISAILLCALWHESSEPIGLLHPKPSHIFRRELLPKIKFGKLKDGYDKGIFEVEWI